MTKPLTVEIELDDLIKIREALGRAQCLAAGVAAVDRDASVRTEALNARADAMTACDLISKAIRKDLSK